MNMMTSQFTKERLIYGDYELAFDAGVVLTKRSINASIYFQPGDDSAQFLEEFEGMQEAQPKREIADILHHLFREYEV